LSNLVKLHDVCAQLNKQVKNQPIRLIAKFPTLEWIAWLWY